MALFLWECVLQVPNKNTALARTPGIISECPIPGTVLSPVTSQNAFFLKIVNKIC